MAQPQNNALRLASTAIPLREGASGIEVLMVKRNEELSFGGMWTFPGGMLEPADGPTPGVDDEDSANWGAPALLASAANAAVRETFEETGLQTPTSTLAWFSHWIPPKGVQKRFATWFFLAPESSGDLVVDQRENSEARWLCADEALAANAAREFPLVAPTWCTLHDLSLATTPGALIDQTITQGPRYYHTRAFRSDSDSWLVWEGDDAYESGDLALDGARNRARIDRSFSVVERLAD